jgi:F-type H+-transporting ATPase subunit a
MYISFIENLVVEVLGEKFRKITPYFIYLFSYILVCNLISIVGLDNPTGSLTVTLSMAIVTVFCTIGIGFKYQRWSFLKKFTFNYKNKPLMVNPFNIISQFTPLISLSFRL